MSALLNPLLSCKFLLAMATLASVSGYIADGVYSAVVIAVVGVYIAGNVAQKATAKGAASGTTPQ